MIDNAGKYAEEYHMQVSDVLETIKGNEGNIRHAWLGPILSDAYKRASKVVLGDLVNAEVDAPPTRAMFNRAMDSLSSDQTRMYGGDVQRLIEDDFNSVGTEELSM